MSVSKVQQSDCYTQLCYYGEEYVVKPMSNQLSIFLGCNLSFTKSLKASYLEMVG